MQKFLFLLVLALSLRADANMQQMVFEGTLGARPFVSEYVDITHEDLDVVVNKGYKDAWFTATYHIQASKSGYQIPLLFYASEYLDSFEVLVDGKRIETKPARYLDSFEGTEFTDFSHIFENPYEDADYTVLIEDSPNSDFHVRLDDMMYFETDISQGEHTIRVRYLAHPWRDQWGWVDQYSFRYVLSPAKYWKSFGTLHLKMKFPDTEKYRVFTNLESPQKGELGSSAYWEFDTMPAEVILINYTPVINFFASILIWISPMWLAIVWGLLLSIFLWRVMVWYRHKKPTVVYSVPMIVGSIFIPLIFVFSWFYFYHIIDLVIGPKANGVHGYVVYVVFLYPFILPVYWLIFWLIDRNLKRKHTEVNTTPEES